MSNNTMLYKMPGKHRFHGGEYDYMIVDSDDVAAFQAAKRDGWHETTPEAKNAYEASQAPKVAVEGSPKLGRPPKKQVEQNTIAIGA